MSDKSQTLGQQIRRLRQARGWTLADLGGRAGTRAPTIHRYENGWDRFEPETLRRLSSALGPRTGIQLVPRPGGTQAKPVSPASLIRPLTPRLWDHDLRHAH